MDAQILMLDREAFLPMVLEHHKEIWRYLRFLGCDPSMAEDLTQETFLAVLRKPFKVIDRAATAAYVRRVARNLFIDHLRRHRRQSSLDLEAAETVWMDYAGEDGGEGHLEALRGCLERLDERSRQVVEARYGRGQGREQIGQDLGLGREGVKTLLRRALERLGRCVDAKVKHG